MYNRKTYEQKQKRPKPLCLSERGRSYFLPFFVFFRLRRSFFLVGCLVELVSDHDDAVVFHTVLVNSFCGFEVALHCEQGTLGDLGKRIGVGAAALRGAAHRLAIHTHDVSLPGARGLPSEGLHQLGHPFGKGKGKGELVHALLHAAERGLGRHAVAQHPHRAEPPEVVLAERDYLRTLQAF